MRRAARQKSDAHSAEGSSSFLWYHDMWVVDVRAVPHSRPCSAATSEGKGGDPRPGHAAGGRRALGRWLQMAQHLLAGSGAYASTKTNATLSRVPLLLNLWQQRGLGGPRPGGGRRLLHLVELVVHSLTISFLVRPLRYERRGAHRMQPNGLGERTNSGGTPTSASRSAS